MECGFGYIIIRSPHPIFYLFQEDFRYFGPKYMQFGYLDPSGWFLWSLYTAGATPYPAYTMSKDPNKINAGSIGFGVKGSGMHIAQCRKYLQTLGPM